MNKFTVLVMMAFLLLGTSVSATASVGAYPPPGTGALSPDINGLDIHFRCGSEDKNSALIKPAAIEEPAPRSEDFGEQEVERESFLTLDKARLEAAHRLPRDERHETGFLLYERDDGRVGISDMLSGTAHALDPISLASQHGRTLVRKGTYGVDGNYPVLEIIHTHPPHSTPMLSGGHGNGDVYVAESLGVNVSVVYRDRVYLYEPQGRSIARRLNAERGERVAMLREDR